MLRTALASDPEAFKQPGRHRLVLITGTGNYNAAGAATKAIFWSQPDPKVKRAREPTQFGGCWQMILEAISWLQAAACSV